MWCIGGCFGGIYPPSSRYRLASHARLAAERALYPQAQDSSVPMANVTPDAFCFSFQAGAGLEAQVFSEFLVLVPEINQFHEVLNKIFRKKIKRAKVCSTHTFFVAPFFSQYTLAIFQGAWSSTMKSGVHSPPFPAL